MIGQLVVYTLAVSVALGVVGLCCERLAALCGWPRRMVWAITIVACMAGPAAAVLMAGPRVAPQMLVVEDEPAAARSSGQPARPATVAPQSAGVLAQTRPELDSRRAMDMAGQATHEPDVAQSAPAAQLVPTAVAAPPGFLPQLSGTAMLVTWALVSAALWLYLLVATVLLRRRAASWRRERVLGQDVLVSPDTGPALCGAWQPRIVVPQWLLELPAGKQALVLAHERQHLLARDPLLLRAAQLAVAAMPWNLPLWWQLRRLRLAIELDCDARVLRGGAEAAGYGAILLAVAQRSGAAPFGTVAMSRPLSVLEYRIRNLVLRPARRAGLQVAGAMTLAAASMAVALALDAPALPLRPVPPPAAGDIAAAGDTAVAAARDTAVAAGGDSALASQPEPALTVAEATAQVGAASPIVPQASDPGTTRPPPPAPLDTGNPAAVADRVVEALAAAHPELVDGTTRGGWYSGVVVLRADGSVFRTALRHAQERSRAIRDILDLRYIPTAALARPVLRVPAVQGSQVPMEARRAGDTIRDGRSLRDNLIFQYAVLPPRTDESRTLLAVWEAVLARHGALLLPRDAGFANRVTVLLTDDGRIASERVETGPREQMLGGSPDFGALGIRPEDVGVWGTTTVTRNDYSDADAAPAGQQVIRAALASALRVQDELVVHYVWPRREGEPVGGSSTSEADRRFGPRTLELIERRQPVRPSAAGQGQTR